MLDWLKTILGENYSDEIDKQVSKKIGSEFVPRSEFNSANSEKKTLQEQVSERDKQLETLKGGAADSDALKKQISELQKQNKDAQGKYDAEMKEFKRQAAVNGKLTAAGAVNGKAVKALFDMSKISIDDNGNVLGFDDQLDAIKKANPWAFPAQPGAEGAEGAENSTGTGGTTSTTGTTGATGVPQGSPKAKPTGVEAAFFARNPDLAPKT